MQNKPLLCSKLVPKLAFYCLLLFLNCTHSRWSAGKIRNDILPRAVIPSQAVEELLSIDLNGVKQWVLIRGHNHNNPVMLSVHGGPGYPNMWNIETAGKLLEHDFTVVYWEQRGTMKSWNKKLNVRDVSIELVVQDIITLSTYLIQRFKQPKIYLRGESFGTIASLYAVSRRPDLFCAYIANSQFVAFYENERLSWAFADSCAQARCDKKAIKKLSGINPESPQYSPKLNLKLKTYIAKYGGWFFNRNAQHKASAFKSFGKMWRTPEYSYQDMLHVMRHPTFTSECVRYEAREVNFFEKVPRVEVPVFFMTGRHDKMVPSAITWQYFQHLVAPAGKFFIWFENSAHTPMFEEPYAYYRKMLYIKAYLEPGPLGITK